MDFSIEQIEQYSQINDISLCYGANQRDGSFGLLVCFCCNKQAMCQRI